MTNATDFFERTARGLPRFRGAHWLLRLPLAGIILQQGLSKVPLTAAAAEGWGVPFFAWALAAFGEIAAGLLLLVGGVVPGGIGDLMTRIAGAGIAVIVAGVIVVAYWAPPLEILLYNQFQLLLLVGGLFFALWGNAHRRDIPA